MKKIIFYLAIIHLVIVPSCAKKLANIENQSLKDRATTYEIIKDVAYGSDAEQKMDLYLSKKAKSYGKRNYTVVFLHGGGYYLSDKSQEEKYIEPYLQKGLTVVNLNYRLKRGIPMATSDLTNALNFLKNSDYDFNLKHVIVTGFSAGAHIATNVGVAQNNQEYPNQLDDGITITGIINFSGSFSRLDTIERIFTASDNTLFREIGKAFFPSTEGYVPKEQTAVYEPITYFDQNDLPIFLWYGGQDNQIPPETYETMIPMLDRKKDFIMYIPNGRHSPNHEELKNAYINIFRFLDGL